MKQPRDLPSTHRLALSRHEGAPTDVRIKDHHRGFMATADSDCCLHLPHQPMTFLPGGPIRLWRLLGESPSAGGTGGKWWRRRSSFDCQAPSLPTPCLHQQMARPRVEECHHVSQQWELLLTTPSQLISLAGAMQHLPWGLQQSDAVTV